MSNVVEVTAAQYAEITRLLAISRQLREASKSGDCTLKEKLALQRESNAYAEQARAIGR